MGLELGDQEIVVQFPGETRDYFSSPRSSHRLWDLLIHPFYEFK